MKKSIYTNCPMCNENGMEMVSSIVDDETVNTEVTCRTCGGARKTSNSFLSKALIDDIEEIKAKVDIIIGKLE